LGTHRGRRAPRHDVSRIGSDLDDRLTDDEVRRGRVGASACFLLTGFLFATWASRIPAIKGDLGISEGELAIAFTGLNAGAILGLQLGGLVVLRLGSRPTLVVALVASFVVLVTPALASNLLLLVASLCALATANSVVDVAMNAQGVAVERGYGRPLLSSMHAMHSLGGIIGAGLGALTARFEVGSLVHFVFVAVIGATGCLAASRLLLPTWVDAGSGASPGADRGQVTDWFAGWSGSITLLGALAFCVTLAEGSALDWSAVYVSDSLGGGESLGAVGLGTFLAAVTLGRLVADRLVARFGPVLVYRVGVLTAGIGFGVGLWIDTPVAGLAGLALLGAGISYALPLAISAGSKLPGEEPATAAARVSTLAYLGSFIGPGVTGVLASRLSLPLALAVPAVLVAATALGADAVRGNPEGPSDPPA
jgi:MFS family permease